MAAINWDAIGKMVSALAVLVTLIYLAVQISQTPKMQQTEAVRATRAERRECFASLRDSPYVPEILEKCANGEDLTYAEGIRLTTHHSAHWGQLYSAWLQDKLELSGGFNTSMGTNFRYAWSNPDSHEWVKQYGENLYPKEFVEEAMRFKEDSFGDYALILQQSKSSQNDA